MSEKNNLNETVNFSEHAVKLVKTIKNYKRLLIYIKGSPDPDAIAGSFALKLLCEINGGNATIVSPLEPSLPQNAKMIKDLKIPVRFKGVEDPKKQFDAYAVLDHQSVTVEDITGVLPCALHIDHHEIVETQITVDLPVLVEEVGSTSTIMIFLLKELGIDFDPPQWRRAATAFYYGIQTDTDNFQHAQHLDHKALEIISQYTDKDLLYRISNLPFSREALKFLHQALRNRIVYKDWLIAGVSYVKEKNRDTMGIIGDFLLKREGIKVVVVFGIVEKDSRLTLDASFRTKDENLNLNTLIKKITREGGARKFKGAFQVNLDYFANCPDREQLWQLVYTTTVETLKRSRDEAHAHELFKLFDHIKKKIRDLFH